MPTIHRAAHALGAAALLLAAATAAPCQGADLPALNSLRPTASPAFVLLGVSPTEVTRPTSMPDLGLDVASVARTFSSVPQNYALEASPFWLRGHSGLSWQNDTTRSIGQSVARTLGISVATAETGTALVPRTGVAFGLRTMLLSGHIPAAVRDTLARLGTYLASEGALFERYAAPQRALDDAWASAELARIGTLPATDKPAALRAFQEANEARKAQRRAIVEQNAAYRSEVAAGRKRFDGFAMRREGAMLEVAAGSTWDFAGRDWQTGQLGRAGVWATYSCEGCVLAGGAPVTPLVLVRYTHARSDDANVLDAGGRLILSGGRYDLSAEGVARSFLGKDTPTLYRVAGIFDYQVQQNLWLLASFGRDYQTAAQGSLVAQLGLKFNFAQARYATP
ncbi:MAG TPA: hypothetical protein VFH27_11330 [Longimicrobiaceae bacterium]|nr:hypothetical protein [Longimicrobiaceae bacterium]